MIPRPNIKVEDRLSSSLRRLVDSRESRSGTAGAMNMAMQWWVSFIMAKQTVASRAGIRERLMERAERAKTASPVRRFNRTGKKESSAKRYLQLRDTKAAAIVWATNYQGARWMTPKDFISTVGRFVARRQYSAGHHKAGFRPALNTFKMARGQLGVAPNYPKISSIAEAAHPVSESILEVLVRNAADGASRNPTGGAAAVEASKHEVVVKLENLIKDNLLERADALGFRSR